MAFTIEKDGITKSLLSFFMQCPRKFSFIINGLARKPSVAMTVGTYGHKALEIKRKTGLLRLPVVKEGAYLKSVITGILKILCPAYFDFWQLQENGKPHKPEVVFDLQKDGMRLRGRIDDQLPDGIILDTKFKGRVDDSAIVNSLKNSIDGLFLCYANNCRDFILDVVKMPRIIEGKEPDYVKINDEVRNNPQEYFKRFQITYSDEDIINFRDELLEYVNLIKCAHNTRNLAACWNCDFVNYCTAGDKTGLMNQELFTELK